MSVFFLTFNRFPFVSKNPIGYLIAVYFEYIVLGYEYFIAACTLALGMGAFWVIVTINKEIRHIFYSINKKAQAKTQKSYELKVLVLEFIDAHAAIKQLSKFKFINCENKNEFYTRNCVLGLNVEEQSLENCSSSSLSCRKM